jgi:hypothetical protein
MKFLRLMGVVYLGVILVNLSGCASHYHETEVVSERVVEQEEVVE